MGSDVPGFYSGSGNWRSLKNDDSRMLSSQRVLGYLLEVFLEGKWGLLKGPGCGRRCMTDRGRWDLGPMACCRVEPEGEESVPGH